MTDPAASSATPLGLPLRSSHVLRALPLGEVADRLPKLLLLLGEAEAEPRHRFSPIGLMTSSPNRASAVSVAS